MIPVDVETPYRLVIKGSQAGDRGIERIRIPQKVLSSMGVLLRSLTFANLVRILMMCPPMFVPSLYFVALRSCLASDKAISVLLPCTVSIVSQTSLDVRLSSIPIPQGSVTFNMITEQATPSQKSHSSSKGNFE